jgi:hypothetical protein
VLTPLAIVHVTVAAASYAHTRVLPEPDLVIFNKLRRKSTSIPLTSVNLTELNACPGPVGYDVVTVAGAAFAISLFSPQFRVHSPTD